jgi:hypothetical protein
MSFHEWREPKPVVLTEVPDFLEANHCRGNALGLRDNS